MATGSDGRPSKLGGIHPHLRRKLVSLRELAERWDVSRATVRRRLREGRVRAYYIGGGEKNGTIRYPAEEVDAFLRRCQGE